MVDLILESLMRQSPRPARREEVEQASGAELAGIAAAARSGTAQAAGKQPPSGPRKKNSAAILPRRHFAVFSKHNPGPKTYKTRCFFTQKHNPGPKSQDAQAQTVEKGIDRNDSQKSALGPRKANAMTASSVSSS